MAPPSHWIILRATIIWSGAQRSRSGRSSKTGSGSRTTSVDVRVMAATNQNNSRSLLGSAPFGANLFYRLNVFPIGVTRCASGSRTSRFSSRTSSAGSPSFRKNEEVPDEVIARFERAVGGQGDVRELQNVIEGAVVATTRGELADDAGGWLAATARTADEPELSRTGAAAAPAHHRRGGLGQAWPGVSAGSGSPGPDGAAGRDGRESLSGGSVAPRSRRRRKPRRGGPRCAAAPARCLRRSRRATARKTLPGSWWSCSVGPPARPATPTSALEQVAHADAHRARRRRRSPPGPPRRAARRA